MFDNYDGVLKVDGSVGDKKQYDPRAWGKVAESAMAVRVGESTRQLGPPASRSPHRAADVAGRGRSQRRRRRGR